MTLGRVDVMYRWSLITLVMLCICLLIGVQWGLQGAALGYLVSTLVCAPLSFRAMLKLVGAGLADAWHALKIQTLLSAGMGSLVYALSLTLPSSLTDLQVLSACIPIGVFIYVSGLYLFDGAAMVEVSKLAQSVISKGSSQSQREEP